MNKLWFLLRYLNYYIKAKTMHGVHPPFLFHLVTDVINNNKKHSEYHIAESLRTTLLNNNKEIYCEDFGTGVSSIRTISSIAKNSAKPPRYAQLLFRLVKELKPDTIIELGTSLGVSTTYMALASPETRIITIEGSKKIADIAKDNFIKNNLNNIEVINNKIDDVLLNILNANKKIDLMFFDGNHRKQATINYFEQCLPSHHNDTVFIFDDIHWSKEMEEAWEHIIANSEVTLSIDLFFLGIVFFRKGLSKENFLIRF